VGTRPARLSAIVLTTTEEAEAALQAWATVQRDELVQVAHQAGVSKNRIHAITGIARTTIDRIPEGSVGTPQQQITAYLLLCDVARDA
jgi:hypothetical protein